MPRVDFYILQANNSKEHFVCVLTNKIWKEGHTVYIYMSSHEAAEAMDNLLWTYKDISFLPHGIFSSENEQENAVNIGWQSIPQEKIDVLINLSDEFPLQSDNFARIIEIVAENEPDKIHARKRYKQYRDMGYELKDHQIENQIG